MNAFAPVKKRMFAKYFFHSYGAKYDFRYSFYPVINVDFRTREDGSQRAFIFKSREFSEPARVIVCFSGTGQLVLNLVNFLTHVEISNTAFLLIDNPGQGYCEGVPTMESTLRVSLAAARAAAEALKIKFSNFCSRASVFGYSLGAAIGLRFAIAARIGGRCILVSPFDTMLGAVDSILSKNYRPFISGFFSAAARYSAPQFDNVSAIREFIGERSPRAAPDVTIYHGCDDDICAFAASEQIAAEHGRRVCLVEIPSGTHNIISTHYEEIAAGVASV